MGVTLYFKFGALAADIVIGTIVNASIDSNIMEISNTFFMFSFLLFLALIIMPRCKYEACGS